MVLENETEIEKATGKVPDEDGLLPLAVSYDMQLCYESGIALNLNPDILQQATVTPETFKEIEKTVPCFTRRPLKKYVRCPTGEISGRNFVFVVFDIETSCGGKAA